MCKRYLRWLAPLIVLLALTTYLALATLVSTHAAAPAVIHHAPAHTISQPYNIAPHAITPNIFKRGF